ncbi:acyltransferase [Lacinutrix undariae]
MRPIINYFNSLIIPLLPETRCFVFKRFLLRLAGVVIGDNTSVTSSVKMLGVGNLVIGSNTWIGPETLIMSTSNIYIGNNVDIAPRVYIGNGTHELGVDGVRMAGKGISKDISIGTGTWICTGAIILPGVTIGKMCVVAAGAVVSKDVKDNMLVGGIPAKYIKELNKK